MLLKLTIINHNVLFLVTIASSIRQKCQNHDKTARAHLSQSSKFKYFKFEFIIAQIHAEQRFLSKRVSLYLIATATMLSCIQNIHDIWVLVAGALL